MGRRYLIPLLFLVLLIAPVATVWCSTVCLAMAVSSGCAHGLQPTDDMPVEKVMPEMAVRWTVPEVVTVSHSRVPDMVVVTVPQRTPLRI